MLPRMLQKMTLGSAIVSAQAVAARLLPKGTAVRGDEVSVIGHGINAADGQEYVVYYGDQCYVEYLLYFSRKDSSRPSKQEFVN